jgi:hypothetical protein
MIDSRTLRLAVSSLPPRSTLCRLSWAPALAMLAATGACDRPKEPPAGKPPEVTAVPSPAAPAPAAAPSTGGVKWTDPPRWKRLPVTSPMRKASYQVPKADGDAEDGELSVFHFGAGQGGGIEPNVDRWVGQFKGVDKSQVKRSSRSANGMVQHIIEIERGTFSSGMPGGPTTPKSDYALLGAIVEAPDGNWFFKLTGPVKTVQKAKDEFTALLDSVKSG